MNELTIGQAYEYSELCLCNFICDGDSKTITMELLIDIDKVIVAIQNVTNELIKKIQKIVENNAFYENNTHGKVFTKKELREYKSKARKLKIKTKKKGHL